MSTFWVYFQIGLGHVIDFGGYNHILFLLALIIPYDFKDWRKILLLVTIFTLGHIISLILSVFGIVTIMPRLAEFLIPMTVLVMALFNLFSTGRSSRKDNINFMGPVTLFFGFVHGLGFSNYFKSLLTGSAFDKVGPLLQYALGIIGAQLIVVVMFLLIAFIIRSFFRVTRRDWILVVSALVVGAIIPIIAQNEMLN